MQNFNFTNDYTHGIGQENLGDAKSAQEAMEAMGALYAVEKRPVHNVDGVELPYFETYRTDTGANLGLVGRVFNPIQNADAFSFFDTLIADKKARYVNGGLLKGGAKVWLLAELSGKIMLPGSDELARYVFMLNGFDGWTHLMARLTPMRIACGNALHLMIQKVRHQIRIKHTLSAEAQMGAAMLQLGSDFYGNVQPVFEKMIKARVDGKKTQAILKSVFPDPPKAADGQVHNARAAATRDEVTNVICTDPTIVGTKAEDTVWGVYNGITRWVDHVRPVQNEVADDWRRFASVWLNEGSGVALKERAFAVCQKRVAKA